MERFYRQIEPRTEPGQRGMVAANHNIYNPRHQPIMDDTRNFYQHENFLNTSNQVYLQHSPNIQPRIRDVSIPDGMPMYGSGYSRVDYFNEYQELSGNEYSIPVLSNVNIDEDYGGVPTLRQGGTSINQQQCYNSNSSRYGVEGKHQGAASHMGNVHTQPDAVSHASGYGGSVHEAAQTSNGSTSVQNDLQSVGKGKYSEKNTTREKNIAHTAPKEGSMVKDASKKQKDIHASGMRIFTGSVEKVIKWHRVLSDTGANIMYDVVARCVSVRKGKSCEKLLLLRDASGPVLQVIYYEIDFLLPEVQPGTTLRIIGKMVGSNRMTAFKVREAYDGETSSLPRLCAISQHMVTKILNFR